jgi:hypothetical protein
MKKKENDAPSPQPRKKDATTGKRTKRGIRSLPSVPDSDPLFKRGFVIGGRGFSGSRPSPKKED